MELNDGLYDLLVTEALSTRFDPKLAEVAPLKGGSAEVLAEAITRQLAAILEELPGDDPGKATRQLELVNGLLVTLRDVSPRSPSAAAAQPKWSI